MTYLKMVLNGYVMSVLKAEYQSDIDGEPITEAEYLSIQNAMKSIPSAVNGYARMLRVDNLEWELVELPPMPDPADEDISADEALDIILGGDGE